ncbi:hypothetical protein CFP65_4601 [Kitasatospora sp. MMS16-BH015]|uniref:Uma2 family endonuclease n=1 Tax=Kitasatospora sp. MMS16-BH015 TaxID=2018025 RepID=UPI000CA0EA06|nr:Uma2 family endonuclease [Kitasatospora sp. MMS16-BH015]AUG79338.1 hypothetical protein CFP65_4601 [Kitasatospora sp. MMS16-BH015]
MTAEPIDLMHPPSQGWTYEQARELDLPFDWELVDGAIVVRGQTNMWHDLVRSGIERVLFSVRQLPYAVLAERCVMIAEDNVTKPDVVVFDKTGLDAFDLECLPVEAVTLAVEVVSFGSRSADRFRKPGQYAEKGIPYYWRVERGTDNLPVVHEFRRDTEQGVYLPVAQHEGLLRTDLPYPVEIDLKQIVEL